MSQSAYALFGEHAESLSLPGEKKELMPGVRWGRFDEFFTPAFWAVRLWLDKDLKTYSRYKLGRSLKEEVAACLLGGFGLPSEVGLAAFHRVRDAGLLETTPSTTALQDLLTRPLLVEGRSVRYRYPRQRSEYLAKALARLQTEAAPQSDLEFRDWLLSFRGIGPKTASWITRNWLDSDKVAIIDVHIHRAGLLAGIFNPREPVARHYFRMEAKFLEFAAALDASVPSLDTLIWRHMKHLNALALQQVALL